MTKHLATLFVGALLAAPLTAQSYSQTRHASPDAFSPTPVSTFLDIPGVGADFKIQGDGQLVERADGTARLSALIGRSSATDRRFLVTIELSGLVLPGQPSHPPVGALPAELLDAIAAAEATLFLTFMPYDNAYAMRAAPPAATGLAAVLDHLGDKVERDRSFSDARR